MRRLFRLTLSILLTLSVFRCFYALHSTPPVPWDEATNLTVISESASARPFPLLYFRGGPFFEKPPLWYWIVLALPFRSDSNRNPARTVSAVCGLLVILSTVYITYRLWGARSAIVAWLVVLTSQQLFVMNPAGIFSTHTFRTADMDSLFILLLLATFGLFSIGKINTVKSILIGICSGLAVLTKGPLGLSVLVLCTLSGQSVGNGSRRYVVYMWLSAACTVVPWYAYMLMRFGNAFIQIHVRYHLIERAFTALEGHTQPWWYFIGVISGIRVFPFFIPLLAASGWILYRGTISSDRHLRRAMLLMCLYVIVPTLMRTRLAWYILPFYPFAAMTLGAFTRYLSEPSPRKYRRTSGLRG